MFSPKYLSHFQIPKNLGIIENPSASTYVQYKGKGCFDKINMYIKMDGDTVEDIRYQVRGCSGTIAACSALTSLVKGNNINDVKQITREQIKEELGGIPEQKEHSVDLAMEALQNLLSKLP
jgi:nitrogen fixation NifU-like protein